MKRLRVMTLIGTMGLAACAAQPQRAGEAIPEPTEAMTQASAASAAGAATAGPVLNDAERQAVSDNRIVILFQPGSASLTAEANERLDTAARLFRDASPVMMFSTGYADTDGAEYPNLILSANRAAVIKNALVRRGIPEGQLLMRALGESELADKANPMSPENRRVTITWRMT